MKKVNGTLEAVKASALQRKRDDALMRYYKRTGRTPRSTRAKSALAAFEAQPIGWTPKARKKSNGMTKAQWLEYRRGKNEQQRRWREQKRKERLTRQDLYHDDARRRALRKPVVATSHFAKLDHCPHCHANFYYTLPS